MASIFTEDFESGTNGAALTTANTIFTSVDAGWTFSAASPTPVHGSLNGKVSAAAATSAVATNTFTGQPVLYRRFYVQLNSYPVGSGTIVHLALSRAAGTNQGQIRVNTAGNLVLRDGGNTAWTSTTILPLNQWIRIEWRLDVTNHQQQIRLFTAGNVDGTTPTEDSGNATLTAPSGNTDEIRLGLANNTSTAALAYYYDAVADNNATWPGPANTPVSLGTAAANWSATATAVGSTAGILWEETFESGTNVAAITTANAQFASVDAGCTFAAAPVAAQGLLGARVDVLANATVTMIRQFGAPQTLRYYRFYLNLPSYPGSAAGISYLRSAGVVTGSLRVNSSGTLALRDGSTTRWTSTALPTNEWLRVEVMVDSVNTAFRVRLFTGTNVHGTTADQDSGAQTLTTGNPDQVSFGCSNGAAGAWNLFFDAIADSVAGWVGPTAGGNPNPSISWAENFEAGTSGLILDKTNTSFSAVDPGWTFANVPSAAQGSLAAQLAVGPDDTNMLTRQRGTAALYFFRFYIFLPSYPATANGISYCKSGGTVISSLRINPTGSLALRDGSTTRWTSAALPLNQWIRIEGNLDTANSRLQARIFTGLNVHGVTPDQDSGAQTLTAGNLDQITFGCDNGSVSSWTLLFDAVAESLTTWVGAVAGGNAAPNAAWTGWTVGVTANGNFTLPTTPQLLARPTQIVPNATFTTHWQQPLPAVNSTYDLRGSRFEGYFFADAIFGFGTFSDGNGGTTATDHQKNIVPVEIGADSTPATAAAIIGGLVTGDQDTTLTWEQMKHGTPTQTALDAGQAADDVYNSVIINNQNQDGDPRIHIADGSWAVVDGLRAYNTHDGFGVIGATSNIASDTGRLWMRNTWIWQCHDDAIENDLSYLELHVDDCLFEDCFSFISTRANVTTGDPVPGQTQNVNNSIISLVARPGPHKQPSSVIKHGHMYKFQSNSPGLVMADSIFAVSAPATSACVTLPERPGLDSYSNVTIVWTGGGSYPGNVPAGCTVTTDASILDQAISRWKRRHGVTDFENVNMAQMIAPAGDVLVTGTNGVSLRVGSTSVSKAYVGTTQVWP